MADPIENTASASDGFAITPNDSADLTQTVRGIYVGGTGDIKLVTPAGTTLTFVAVPAGVLPVCATKVFATDTDATSLIGLI